MKAIQKGEEHTYFKVGVFVNNDVVNRLKKKGLSILKIKNAIEQELQIYAWDIDIEVD